MSTMMHVVKLSFSSLPSRPNFSPPLYFPQPFSIISSPNGVFDSSAKMRLQCSKATVQERLQPPLQDEPKNRMEVLTQEIAESLGSSGYNGEAARELYAQMRAINIIESLGIHWHFTDEIKDILQLVYRKWDKDAGLGSVKSTALGFRLLRLNGYQVFADVLEIFRGEDHDGELSSLSNESYEGLQATLDLYLSSQLAFPIETQIMGEVARFTEKRLREALLQNNPLLQTNHLIDEIEFALSNSRKSLWPRLRPESRCLAHQLWPGNKTNEKYLELAILEMNSLQKLYLEEIEELNRWWADSGLDKFEFARYPVLKCHFIIAAGLFEPEFHEARMAFVKIACMSAIHDDIFDLPTSRLEDLSLYFQAVERWDLSGIDGLPEHMSLTFKSFYATVNSISEQASKSQGCNLFLLFREIFTEVLWAHLKEAEWRVSGDIPTFDEYMKVGPITAWSTTCITSTIFLMGEYVSDEALKSIGPSSNLLNLVSVVCRLSNDIVTFEREASHGEMASAIGCYMRDHPNCTQEQAVAQLKDMIESSNHEIEREWFKCQEVAPDCCSRAAVHVARFMSLLYGREDGFSNAPDSDFETLVKDFYYKSLP
ncbi:hypothetical protein AMTRI_Chr11g100280 [Amborella trichopoda]